MNESTKVINRGKREKFIIRRNMDLELGSSMASCAVSLGNGQVLRVNKDLRAFINKQEKRSA